MKPAILLLTSFVGACAATPGALNRTLPSGSHYVALGSSFAAGAGIEPRKPGGPTRCGRSQRNYASLLAERLHLALDDQTCNGARTTHLLSPWNELPAQLDAVGADTRLVTATIGGNDINYAGYLTAAGCGPDGMAVFGGGKYPCPAAKPPTEAEYNLLEKNMRAIVRQAKARAPQARVILVQYVAMVPDRPCDAARLPDDKAQPAREIGRRLAEITAGAAQAEGGEILAMDQLARNHRPCDSEPWSFGTTSVASEGVIWHPSRRGHAAIANLLAERLGN